VVEDVGGDLDERDTLRRAARGAERLAQVEADALPLEHARRRLGERGAHLDPVGLLERSDAILGGRVLASDADDGRAGERRAGKAGHGVGQPAARGDTAYANSAAGARVGVGGIHTCLLMSHVHQHDVVRPQRAEDRKGVAAVDREQVTDAGLAQGAADDRTAVDQRDVLGRPPVQRLLPIHVRHRCLLARASGAGVGIA
jgi:hypothetical protein